MFARWAARAVLCGVLLGVVPAAASAAIAWARYVAADGSYELHYPRGWDVVPSDDGRAVAIVGPPVMAAGVKLRPSLVVSVVTVPPAATWAVVQQTAAQAIAQALPQAAVLGEETVAAADGYPLWIRYYAAPAQYGPPMYLVTGAALRTRLYVLVGSTSSALPDYRQQAGLLRASMVSFRGR